LTVAASLTACVLWALPPHALWPTLVVCGAGAALLWAGSAGQPVRQRFGVANQVTLLRAALVALLCGALGVSIDPSLHRALTAIAALAALLDAVDGWLARRHATESAFGARFDMETDALFILVLSLLVWQQGQAGPWVLVCGLLRYAFVAAAWVWPALNSPLPFSLRRKRIAALQMILLVAAFSPLFGLPTSAALAALAVLTLVVSFFIDLLWLVRARRRFAGLHLPPAFLG